MTDIALPAGLEQDPEVRAALRRLALSAIAQAEDLIENAAPAISMPFIRGLVTQLSRALVAGSDADELAELRAQIAEMYAKIDAATSE